MIHIGSDAGVTGEPEIGAYSISKAALISSRRCGRSTVVLTASARTASVPATSSRGCAISRRRTVMRVAVPPLPLADAADRRKLVERGTSPMPQSSSPAPSRRLALVPAARGRRHEGQTTEINPPSRRRSRGRRRSCDTSVIHHPPTVGAPRSHSSADRYGAMRSVPCRAREDPTEEEVTCRHRPAGPFEMVRTKQVCMSRPTRVGPIRVVLALSAALLAVCVHVRIGARVEPRRGRTPLPRRRRELHQHRLHGRVVGRGDGAARVLPPVLLRRAAREHGELALEAGERHRSRRPAARW